MRKLLVVWGLAALGCGSSDGGGSTASAQCDDLLTTYCGRAADCIAQLGCDPGYTRDQENTSCLAAARQALACGSAKAVGASYSECLNATSTTACSAFGTSAQCMPPGLPDACRSVILF